MARSGSTMPTMRPSTVTVATNVRRIGPRKGKSQPSLSIDMAYRAVQALHESAARRRIRNRHHTDAAVTPKSRKIPSENITVGTRWGRSPVSNTSPMPIQPIVRAIKAASQGKSRSAIRSGMFIRFYGALRARLGFKIDSSVAEFLWRPRDLVGEILQVFSPVVITGGAFYAAQLNHEDDSNAW